MKKQRYHVLYHTYGNPVRSLSPVVMPYLAHADAVLETLQRIIDELGIDHKVEDRRLGEINRLDWMYEIHSTLDADGNRKKDAYLELIAA